MTGNGIGIGAQIVQSGEKPRYPLCKSEKSMSAPHKDVKWIVRVVNLEIEEITSRDINWEVNGKRTQEQGKSYYKMNLFLLSVDNIEHKGENVCEVFPPMSKFSNPSSPPKCKNIQKVLTTFSYIVILNSSYTLWLWPWELPLQHWSHRITLVSNDKPTSLAPLPLCL